MTGAGFIDTLRKKTGFAGLFSYKYKNPPGDRWKNIDKPQKIWYNDLLYIEKVAA